MKFFLILSIVFISASDEQLMHEVFQMDRCRSLDQDIGLCVPLKSCPFLVNLETQRGKESDVIRFKNLAKMSCGNRMLQNEVLFCCSKPTGRRPTPTLIHEAFPLGGRNYVRQNEEHSPDKSSQSSSNVPLSPRGTSKDTVSQDSVLTSEIIPISPLNKGLKTSSTNPQLTSGTKPTSFGTPPPFEATSHEPITFEGHVLKFDEERKCVDHEGKSGTCISTFLCPPVISRLVANPNSEVYKESLRQSNRICDAHPPVICCPDDEMERVLPEAPTKTVIPGTSGQQKTGTKPRLLTPEEGCGRIYLRKPASKSPPALGSWPWVVLLGYKNENQLSFRCGGSLITSRHVLTAAHCIKNDLQIVRLGEYDLANTWETKHQDIEIARISKHQDYDGTRNDISVLHLSSEVEFTDKIRPACIPDRIKFESRLLEGFRPFVAGWRKKAGEISNVLQEMQLTIYENARCVERRLVPGLNQLEEKIICAGEVPGTNDTCSGDSGGSLMLPDALDKDNVFFDVIGVESYIRKCGKDPLPGVYTNVIFYSTWIKEKVAEEI